MESIENAINSYTMMGGLVKTIIRGTIHDPKHPWEDHEWI